MSTVNYREFFKMAHIAKDLPNSNALFGRNKDGITDKQKMFLRNLGVGTTGIRYKGQAAMVLDIAIERFHKHLATPGQMRALIKTGKKTLQDVDKVTFKEAIKLLDGYVFE